MATLSENKLDLGNGGGMSAPYCTNLADYFTAMNTMTVAWVYSQNAQDAPQIQMSWTLIMKSDNANYGYMFWFGTGAIYCRFLNNGTWGNWTQC